MLVTLDSCGMVFHIVHKIVIVIGTCLVPQTAADVVGVVPILMTSSGNRNQTIVILAKFLT